MFAMYDDDGLRFRNTIDHLYNIHEISASQAVQNNNNGKGKNKQSFEENLHKGKITQEAKNQYVQMANIDVQAEIYHVEQIMSHDVTTVVDSQTIQECYELMKEHNVQQLPIISDIEQHLKGMITKHDILN